MSNGSVSPTASPTTTPEDVMIPVSQDAMLRGGEYSDNQYGKDPFVALTGLERKAILEFDLGTTTELRPNVYYEYTLQMFVSYVAENDQRSVTASCIAPQENYQWDEFDISWNSFGEPIVNEIGWFTIYVDDMETLVSIPLGSLSNCTTDDNNKFILVLEIEDSDQEGDKFDFRSREYDEVFPGMVETPPVLIGVPSPNDDDTN
ncbi:hypothetical protein ACHAWU_002922 [Discostella pseudostelligera]|uniref:Carbohydrate-binding module family 96 domain-containing protein n=1 Tax=Discostella pseudostelligera TaxID=259834 RepID=A0ABD3LZC3_9STRA